MKVTLVEYTPNAEALVATAMKLCHAPDKDGFMAMYKEMKPWTMVAYDPVKKDVKKELEKRNKVKEFISLALKLGHESVLEHISFAFAVEGVSRALTHQLVRHRIASYSQQSQRYVDMSKNNYPSIKPKTIKDSERYITDLFYNRSALSVNDAFDKLIKLAKYTYREMINQGIPKEDARYVLPNACTTKIVITMNARELRHFFKLRCSKHAQWEIREMAKEMLELSYDIAPLIFEDLYKQFVEREEK